MPLLKDLSTRAPGDLEKKSIREKTEELVTQLDELQNRLYATGTHSVLVLFQGLDASGKDGAIRKVIGRLNPQGLSVQSFKVPTEEEKAHDFLWRIHRHAPAKGMIQVFNRSHYEDVLVTRVHGWCNDATALQRFESINDFEQLLVKHNNCLIFKFYLHISREEQQSRFEERKTIPSKNWKHNPNDAKEAALWDKYMDAYEDVFRHCNAQPWTIVPADQNWYKEYIIAQTLVEGLGALKLEYPGLS